MTFGERIARGLRGCAALAVVLVVPACGGTSRTHATKDSSCAQPLTLTIGTTATPLGGCGGTYGVATSLIRKVVPIPLPADATATLAASGTGTPSALEHVTVTPPAVMTARRDGTRVILTAHAAGTAVVRMVDVSCVGATTSDPCIVAVLRVTAPR